MDKIALVTGGTRGIGAGISRALKRSGYAVAASYNNDTAAAESFREVTGIPVFSWNVADFDACEAGVRSVCAAMEGDIDILVNNAGVTKDVMLHKMDPANWRWVLETNLTSLFNMCRIVVPKMREKRYGRIINISSVNGIKGQVGQTNYAAAKAGVLGFTKALALESAAKGITVNAVAPGYISTDMTRAIKNDIMEQIIGDIPVGRFGRVDEVAEAVLFLVTDAAAFITGTVLSVNGGQHM
ncbi:MAG: acetoacetyl-CoA reductase [Holosporaceae bacterium]|jgi:acetoacetyl-CoA reductase|nr:acetoacetyl-CoA reductase [Holosporaceae bacterium]